MSDAEPVKRRYRSEEEGKMRTIMSDHLRQRWPGARIIHEFPLRYSSRSLDMAAILPAEIVAVEIKSSKDVLDRLERQLRAFAPICTRIMVALAPKWNEKLPQIAKPSRHGHGIAYSSQYTEAQAVIRGIRESHIETWTCCAETGSLKNTDGGWAGQRFPWPARMLDVLHVAELEVILTGSVPRKVRTHSYLVEAIHQRLTGPAIIRAVCGALRTRKGFAVGSDPPIGTAPVAPIMAETEQLALIA